MLGKFACFFVVCYFFNQLFGKLLSGKPLDVGPNREPNCLQMLSTSTSVGSLPGNWLACRHSRSHTRSPGAPLLREHLEIRCEIYYSSTSVILENQPWNTEFSKIIFADSVYGKSINHLKLKLFTFCRHIWERKGFADMDMWRAQGVQSGPEVINFSCSTQLSMKFIMLINVKMPTIVGLSFIYQHDKYNIWKFESKKSLFLSPNEVWGIQFWRRLFLCQCVLSVRLSIHTFCLSGTISHYLLVRFDSFLVSHRRHCVVVLEQDTFILA